MSDMITSNDPITTWADVRPTQRPLADLRGKVADAWKLYYQAVDMCEAGRTTFEAVVFQAEQAYLLQSQLDDEYRKLNAPPEECTCCLPEQICPVCASRGDPEIPY